MTTPPNSAPEGTRGAGTPLTGTRGAGAQRAVDPPAGVDTRENGGGATDGAGHTARPLVVSGVLSTFAGLVAVLLLANSPAQLTAVVLAVGGLAGVGLGFELRHRGYPLGGGLLAIAGTAGVLAAIGAGAALPREISARLELLPGLVGLFVLVLGLSSVKPDYERWFVSAGAGAMLVGVFFTGFTNGAPAVALLGATVATVVAWDVGEQAINMGEHLGRGAHSWPVEVAHAGVGALVGAVGVGFALAIGGANVQGLPLVGLAALLLAAVVLATAIHA